MQAFLKSIFKFNPTVILSGAQRGLHAAGGPLAYAQYIRYTHRKSLPPNPVEQYAQGYMDHLQQPLQPLMDNLEGETYEGFEKDPIKYRQYEQAAYAALSDRPEKSVTSIFVVGAGRGPLVAGVLRAAERARRRVQVTAVEKNPNAFVILQERQALEWGQSVKLVFSDMRSFNPREKADIIVSELLGSFGDNELSPECLDGVMRCLKRELPPGTPCASTRLVTDMSTSPLCSRRNLDPELVHFVPRANHVDQAAPRSDWLGEHVVRGGPQTGRAALRRHVLCLPPAVRAWRATGRRRDPRMLDVRPPAAGCRCWTGRAPVHEPPQCALGPPDVQHPARWSVPRLCGLL